MPTKPQPYARERNVLYVNHNNGSRSLIAIATDAQWARIMLDHLNTPHVRPS